MVHVHHSHPIHIFSLKTQKKERERERERERDIKNQNLQKSKEQIAKLEPPHPTSPLRYIHQNQFNKKLSLCPMRFFKHHFLL